MKETWASGSIELLRHADSHIKLETAFDSRIAFISIDNSVETSIRTFLSLPEKISGVKFQRKEVEEAGNSFPKMVVLLFDKARQKIAGLDDGDIEHYHRIRNQLYHNGTGLGVDRRYLGAYRQIAAVLLNNLFGVKADPNVVEGTLDNLILLFNEVETLVKKIFDGSGVDAGQTFKWEIAVRAGILEINDIKLISELRMIRNSQVHSTAENIDKKRIELGVEIAEKLIKKMKN
ncbi:hypothetical protein KHV89_21285 [Klebsiella aerogenes]|uniref:hypothetical protein n=1 Tax=Klebsiella aerogenes TaxID=548 RepID=UPI0022DD2E59|nr:hypothetical protein [Klebsiella aerogenes]EKU5794279.1 hypothetical protein [Klebsiella aerogenes]ELS5748509.1 hypothetical protein [Klebsiella aerogenes]WBM97012.1 hypothetical protein KHV89_21285 [Klebsiella aerogenes]HBV9450062.1 hypothetical protein [Klebsiella aerogenes]HBY9529929.1 hypothetical protein [Klebsiella aerogenes]